MRAVSPAVCCWGGASVASNTFRLMRLVVTLCRLAGVGARAGHRSPGGATRGVSFVPPTPHALCARPLLLLPRFPFRVEL